VILVVAHFIKGDTLAERGEVRVFRWSGPVSALAAFPVIVFAYTCHQNVRVASLFNLKEMLTRHHLTFIFLCVKQMSDKYPDVLDP
jgi:amino acid permease